MSLSTDTTTTKSVAPEEEEKGVEYWRKLVGNLEETIEQLQQQLKKQIEKIEQLEAELRLAKKLKGKPQLNPSSLN